MWRQNHSVTLTHKPTGVSARSDQERGQHRNRAKAIPLLLARLFSGLHVMPQKELKLVASYVLPDEFVMYPCPDLEPYKEKIDG